MKQTKFILARNQNEIISIQSHSFQSDRKQKSTHREIEPESSLSKPKQDCNYTFPIDLAPHGSLFGAKYIKTKLQSCFGLDHK